MGKSSFETKISNVKRHLLEGKTLTSWEAIQLYRATRLSAIIFELKNRHGLNIGSEMIVEDGVHYSKYYLKADPILKGEIKDYLSRGNYLTKEVAEQVFDCKYLNVLIAELKEEGLNIIEENVRPLCGKKFTRYYVK